MTKHSKLMNARQAFCKGNYVFAAQLYDELSTEDSPLAKSASALRDLSIRRAAKQITKVNFTKPASLWAGVDIIIPVYNALDDVRTCLQSLVYVRTAVRQRLILVNDGSNDETSRMLREFAYTPKPPHIRVMLIEHHENLGYTKAVNNGLREASAPFVVTLNSDTIVTSEWLEGLIRCMHSSPEIGICGPLSNAASWQNVPRLFGEDKKFAVNPLPAGLDVDGMAALVRRSSLQSYPRTTFVNGFCFMIRYEVLERIGLMDEEAFPMGYGEENDFCIRAQDEGFSLAYADDVYVFHAKSKSFGSELKKELSRKGRDANRQKYGSAKFDLLEAEVKNTDLMDSVRDRIQAALAEIAGNHPALPSYETRPRSIAFLLPVQGGGGGVHSVVQEVAELRRLGVNARVAVRDKYFDEFLTLYSDIVDCEQIFLSYSERTRDDLGAKFDIIVATIFSSVRMVADILKSYPNVRPAYYIQDYEPWFFPADNPLRKEALESYTLIQGCLLFAKTDWLRNQVAVTHGVHSLKVSPSIDHDVYMPRADKIYGVQISPVRITAMIRPRTPRRGADRTIDLLSRLHTAFANRVALTTFGCRSDEINFMALRRDFDFKHVGILRRPEVAVLLQESDIFIDLSDYQAFGRTALEAMACGATVLVPQLGGADEYAVDGVNAIVADTLDVTACFDALVRLLDQPNRLAAMKSAALVTASRYSTRQAAVSEFLVLFGHEATSLNKTSS